MAELGALLREAREDRGISLLEAEQATRIRRVFLQAIEEDRFQDLPGEVYGRGFVRNYARFLGLDPDVIVQQYPRPASPEPVYVPVVLNEPLAPFAHRLTRWILILLVAAVLAAAGWYLYDTYWVGQGWRVQSFWPPAISTPTVPVQESVPDPTDDLPASTATTAVTPEPEATQAPAEAEAQATATPTATATPPRPTPTPTVTPTPTGGVAIEALAEADTYLEVRADGELLWIGILRTSETAEWSAQELMELRIGNAGGLRLLVNGRDVGVLGESGQVINVEYRADELP